MLAINGAFLNNKSLFQTQGKVHYLELYLLNIVAVAF